MKNIFKNKTILITGASGTIGSAIVLSLLKIRDVKVVRAMSNDENGLHELLENIDVNLNSFNLRERMKKKFRMLYGDIRDFKRCIQATKNVDFVIHAAALKHVSICEYNPSEAKKTNIEGTKNIIKAAIRNNVRKVIFVSTDKAVYPSSDMGFSKRVAEKNSLKSNFKNKKNKTKISCVRFGNVLGSRGSVVPRFVNQIKTMKKINLSSKKMTRFVMTIKDAVRLIFKSLKIMKGGEIFIFKSMFSIKILDLAETLQNYYKKKYNKITIKIIGLNNKEKYSEMLMTKKESLISHETKDMHIILPKKKLRNKINEKTYRKIDSANSKFLNKKQILKLLIVNKLIEKL